MLFFFLFITPLIKFSMVKKRDNKKICSLYSADLFDGQFKVGEGESCMLALRVPNIDHSVLYEFVLCSLY